MTTGQTSDQITGETSDPTRSQTRPEDSATTRSRRRDQLPPTVGPITTSALGTWAGISAGAAIGVAWGAATSLGQTVLPGTWNFLANTASPWVAAVELTRFGGHRRTAG